MTFLLDTNVISELRRPERADKGLSRWIARQDQPDLLCSCISMLEHGIGALRALRRDPVQGHMLRTWIDEQVLPRFSHHTVPIDRKIALTCAAPHAPDRRPDRDAYIAATALVHDLTVVTRNARDFVGAGARLCNPWEEA